MSMEKATKFYKLAGDYCRFISENEITVNSVSMLTELLVTLYVSAMHLPEVEPETIGSPSYVSESVPVMLDKQLSRFYWEVFDPYVQEPPVCCDLADDLSDIASDLRRGMKEYEAGRIGNAIFVWKFGLNNHWGNHTVDALRALHAIMSQ